MKIERINENQIRCTLTSADLATRKIRISEFAYGTERARELFRDMMSRARRECGFDAENMPLMIEAIPMGSDSIVLIITRVEDPAELDTRFSRFSKQEEGSDLIGDPLTLTGADDIISKFRHAVEDAGKSASDGTSGTAGLMRLFHFDSLDTVIDAAKALQGEFHGDSALYRRRSPAVYELVLHQSGHTPEEFNRVCNALSEYADFEDCTPAREASFREHAEIVLKAEAVRKLADL